MSDFLWESALEPQGKDRLWIIPDREDLFPYNRTKEDGKTFDYTTILEKNSLEDNLGELIEVNIVEEKGQGVMDLIGGEVWEAALLLCSYILLQKDKFLLEINSILELGAGVGLPSFLLTKLLQSQHHMNTSLHRISVTDNDDVLLDNLKTTIQHFYDTQLSTSIALSQAPQTTDNTKIDKNYLSLQVCQLDWGIFERPVSKESDFLFNETCDALEDTLHPHQTPSSSAVSSFEYIEDILSPLLYHDQYDLLIGSALCYAPYHACLADLLKYYLAGRSKEVIICQIRDREGFLAFQTRLQSLGIEYEIEEISEELYAYAQQIGRMAGSQIINEESTESTKQSIAYYFPLQSPSLSIGNHSQIYHASRKALLKTNKESFVILRIRKQI